MSSASTSPAASEQELLAAAREGDEAAFRRLVEPRHAELHAHCYRMLGSVHDADDALQEALLRAWRGLPGFERRSSLRSWLYKIATNACLDALARRSKRVLPIDYGPVSRIDDELGEPLPDSTWLEPYPDAVTGLAEGFAAPEARYELRESVELAFTAALQHLLPRQRAVLILREVLGFSAREVAETLETTTASVNSTMQRARAAVESRLPEQSQQATLRALGDEQVRYLVEGFIDAWDRGDVDTMVALLADQPTFALPPHDAWYEGRDAVDAFLPRIHGQWRLVPTRANGQLAFAAYRRDDETGVYRAAILDVLTVREGLIADVTAWATPSLFERFGLPAELLPTTTHNGG
ncbi:MAG TPA: sigma-70 family RNA polymerase sigma factor [Solirubrobacterales bacterium]|nr:sigma-70 family RNA polymerase sigma factor [Solirubrobacterales bacterium]